jgi:hypothetical protein
MSQKGSIFDKLTDPSQYTGTHKNRFDENGKGRGIEGRSDRVELDGYVDGFKKKKSTTKKTTTVISYYPFIPLSTEHEYRKKQQW